MTIKSILASLLACALAITASAQPSTYEFQGDLLSLSGALTIPPNSLISVTNAVPAHLRPGRGIALFPMINGAAATGSTGSNMFLQFGATPGINGASNQFNGPQPAFGTNIFFTNTVLLYTNTMAGTNVVQPYILIPASSLDNAEQLSIVTAKSDATNAAGATLSHIYWSITQ